MGTEMKFSFVTFCSATKARNSVKYNSLFFFQSQPSTTWKLVETGILGFIYLFIKYKALTSQCPDSSLERTRLGPRVPPHVILWEGLTPKLGQSGRGSSQGTSGASTRCEK